MKNIILTLATAASFFVAGCGNSDAKDTLVMKGLYIGQSGDDALAACKKLAAPYEDLVVTDFRNGITRKKDQDIFAGELKEYEGKVATANQDVEKLLSWSSLSPMSMWRCSLSKTKGAFGPGFVHAISALAAINGCQVEWRYHCWTPEEREGAPCVVGSFELSTENADPSWGEKEKGIVEQFNINVPKGKVKEITDEVLCAKGYEAKDYNILFRLAPKDGNSVDKAKLVEEFLKLNPRINFWSEASESRSSRTDKKQRPSAPRQIHRFLRGIFDSNAEGEICKIDAEFDEKFGRNPTYPWEDLRMTQKQRADLKNRLSEYTAKKAAIAVDWLLKWTVLDKRNNNAMTYHQMVEFFENSKRSPIPGGQIMMKLAKACGLKVEWGVVARLKIGSSTVSGMFSVPYKECSDIDYKGDTYKYVDSSYVSSFCGDSGRGLKKFRDQKLKEKGLLSIDESELGHLRERQNEYQNQKAQSDWKLEKLNEGKVVLAGYDPEIRLLLTTTNGVEVTKEKLVNSLLDYTKIHAPDDTVRIPPRKLIQIAFKNRFKLENELKGVCFVWIGDDGNVKEVFFNKDGIAKLFNAGDLTCDEFAQALVDNYPCIPKLVGEKGLEKEWAGVTDVTTWIHKDPKGWQIKFSTTVHTGAGCQWMKGASRSELSLMAIKPESARKFD